jgi:dTDP-4-dehydrorhamnose reductase
MSSERLRMVVTGVSGLLGATFALSAERRFAVTGFYGKHALRLPGSPCFSVDLRSAHETRVLLGMLQPQVLVHFAALTNVDRCEEYPEKAAQMNVEATRTLAEWAMANNCRLLLMSTDSVFDGKNGGYTEEDSPRPVNCYAATKLAAEQIVRTLVPDHLIVRASIYGWNTQPKSSLGEWILGSLEAKRNLSGFTDVIFAPLLVNTLAEGLLKLVSNDAKGIIHLASRDSISKFDFAVALASVFGLPEELVQPASLANVKLRAPRPMNTSLCTELAQHEFGITFPSVREDLTRFKHLRDIGFPTWLKSLSTQEA